MGLSGGGPAGTPRALLFDVFGTLVDWRGGLVATAAAVGRACGTDAAWPDVVDDWRRAYQPALDRIREGAPWRHLDVLQRDTLAEVLGRHGVDLPAPARQTLVAGWRRLPAWPDVPEGLERLRDRHVTATLSNGPLDLLVDLLHFAGLRVDAVLSAQLAASYKPEPGVYLRALELLACPPEDAAMVASHAGDLRAAAALGLRPVFLRRPHEWGPAGGEQPPADLPGLLVVTGLGELAGLLAGAAPVRPRGGAERPGAENS